MLALLLALGGSAPARAAGWRVEGLAIPAETADRLAERFPDVRNANDLENLLRDLARRRQVTKLEARYEGGVWVIHGHSAEIVTDIDVGMVTRLLKQPLSAAVQNYIGQVDSPETRAKISQVVTRYMKRRGYPASSVTLATHDTDEGVGYDVAVAEGDPCVIQKVDLPFKLPRGAKLDVHPGDLCDLDEIEPAISNLETELRDNGYNQVRLELGDVTYLPSGGAHLTITGQLGQKVRYEIVDAAHRFLIDDLFGDEELTKIDPTIVGPDAMSAELQRRYMNRGFLHPQIRGPDIKKAGEDEFVYVYYVDPGKQYILTNVQFEGVTVFKQDELLDTLGLGNIWQSNQPFNNDELQQGLTALRARYQQAGYWDAKIREPGRQEDKEAGTVRLTIQVEEGLPRRLRSVTVTGDRALGYPEIRKMLAVGSGEPLDRAKLVDFQQQVRSAYVARGYLYSDVQITLKAEEQKRVLMVDVDVRILEGVRVRVGDVAIIGLVRTEEKVVRRELLFQRGDWYDPEKISQSRQALTRLGLFRSVQINPADRNALQDHERELDLIVDVREGKAGSVSFGPGWSLIKGWSYGAEAAYNNIGGVGRQASIRGSISEERDQNAIGSKTLLGRKIGAGYVEPFVLDLPVDAVFSASQTAAWGGELWDLSSGGEIALVHKLRLLLPGSSVSVFYGQKVAKTEGAAPIEAEELATDVRIGEAGARFYLDFRDSLKFPTKGFDLRSEVAWANYALGGDIAFYRWSAGASYYYGFTDRLVLALGAEATAYEDVQRKSATQPSILPPSERLPAGGSDSVRGYPDYSLGPVVKAMAQDSLGHCSNVTVPIEGTARTTLKTELRRKVSDNVAVTGFIDNGNTFLSAGQYGKFVDAYRNLPEDACGPHDATIQDNFSYSYSDLAKDPRLLWADNYWAYGSTVDFLTALGALNAGYGLPWHQPGENIRGIQNGPWWRRGQFILNVGARF